MEDRLFIDIAPPFWCCTSALACTTTMRVTVWLMKNRGFFLSLLPGRLHRFGVVQREGASGVDFEIGFRFSSEEVSPLPCDIDSQTMTVSIPEDKLSEVLLTCHAWKSQKVASRKQLHSNT